MSHYNSKLDMGEKTALYEMRKQSVQVVKDGRDVAVIHGNLLGQRMPGFIPCACLREGLAVTSDSPKDG